MGKMLYWSLGALIALVIFSVNTTSSEFSTAATKQRNDESSPCQTKIIVGNIVLVNGIQVVLAEGRFNAWMKENYEKVEIISIHPLGNADAVSIVIFYKNKE